MKNVRIFTKYSQKLGEALSDHGSAVGNANYSILTNTAHDWKVVACEDSLGINIHTQSIRATQSAVFCGIAGTY